MRVSRAFSRCGCATAAALVAAAFASPVFAVNYVPQAIAQTGLSNQYGPALGSVVFDNSFGAGALNNGSPSINFLGEVLYSGVTNSSVTLATHLSSTGTPLEGTVTWNQVQGMFMYRPSTSNSTNVFQGGQAYPAPLFGPNAGSVISTEEFFSGVSGYSSPKVTGLFNSYNLNNGSQFTVKTESTRANLINSRPDLGLLNSPGAARDGYRASTVANADDAPNSSINGIQAKHANQTSISFNQSGQWLMLSQLQANPAGASLPVITSTAPDTNTSAVYMNNGTGGVSQMVSRGSDRLTQLDAGGNVRLGSGGPSAGSGMVFNDSGVWVQAWNSMQGTGVVSVSNATTLSSSNAVIISNRGGASARSVDGTTGVGTLSGLDVIMRGGDVAPDGTGAPNATGLRYRQTGNTVDMNNLGHVAFSASLSNPASFPVGSGATQQNGAASGTILFTDAGTGSVHRVAFGAEPLPTVWDRTGTSSGVAFVGSTWGTVASSFSVGSQFTLDASDRLTFGTSTAIAGGDAATLAEAGAPARSQALFQLGTDNKLRMIARNGDVAPGVSAALGSPLGSADHIYFSGGLTSGFTTNGLGQIAFVASLQAATSATGAIISSGGGRNNQALFCTDLDGTMKKILQLGDAWVGADGNTHYILSIGGLNQSGGEDGRARSLSDQGDLTFSISFTDTFQGTTVDGSAVVIAHVPAPGALALLGLGGLIATRRRRA